jgi:hypothetical protein
MVSPFSVARDSVDVPEIEAYVRWTAEGRSVSLENVATATFEFIKFADALVGDWKRTKHYDIARLKERLGAVR